jgi:soluble lytic murein transglycosylase-like protein
MSILLHFQSAGQFTSGRGTARLISSINLHWTATCPWIGVTNTMYTGRISDAAGTSPGQSTNLGAVDEKAGTSAATQAQSLVTADEQQAFAQALAQSLAQAPGDLMAANLLGSGGASGLTDAGGLTDSSLLTDLLGSGGASGLSDASGLTDAPVVQAASPTIASGYTGSTSAQAAIEPWVQQLAPTYGLAPSLVNAVIAQESGFNPNAVSSAGAAGLMQIMPATAASLGLTDPFDPVANLRAGMAYLSSLVRRYNGDIPLALAAYNAGPEAVSQYGGIPPYPQTQHYVTNILSNWASQASS